MTGAEMLLSASSFRVARTRQKRRLNIPALFCRCGPLALPLFLVVSGIMLLSGFRLLHAALYFDRIADTPQYWRLFLIGLRMDLVLLSYAAILPSLALLLLPERAKRALRPVLTLYCTAFMCLIVYMEIATVPFMDEFDLRPDQKFIEYLAHYREVLTTLWKAYQFEILTAAIILIFCFVYFYRSFNYLQKKPAALVYYKSAVLILPVAALIILGARSSLQHRPVNISAASFSDNHLANELALNSTYSLAYAIYRSLRHEKNPSDLYGKIARGEVLARVKANTIFSGTPIASEIPFLQQQASPFTLQRPPNVVIFLQESVGAVDVGCLKGPDVTPNLCRLKNEGLWLSNLYATGTRTARGIEAVFSSFLPTAAPGVIKQERAKRNFFTAGALFKEHGYDTHFLYGGVSTFDEMRAFCLGNGIEHIHDEPTFDNPAYRGTWGVSDEDLVRAANEVFKKQGDKPFFSLMLSTTNHVPYEFPDGRIELFEQPKQTHFNAIKYADYAIGLLFELAKKEPYYANTIFLIVADHNWQVRGNEFVPISKFHIPGLVIGPNVPKKEFDLQASQIDLLPTLLHFTGLTTQHPMVGRNLMALPPGTKGRSFMQFGEHNAYRVNDDVVILRPFVRPEQFSYRNETLVRAEADPDMMRDALAHAHLPWLLYSEQLYRLPSQRAGNR